MQHSCLAFYCHHPHLQHEPQKDNKKKNFKKWLYFNMAKPCSRKPLGKTQNVPISTEKDKPPRLIIRTFERDTTETDICISNKCR